MGHHLTFYVVEEENLERDGGYPTHSEEDREADSQSPISVPHCPSPQAEDGWLTIRESEQTSVCREIILTLRNDESEPLQP